MGGRKWERRGGVGGEGGKDLEGNPWLVWSAGWEKGLEEGSDSVEESIGLKW